MRKIKRDYQKQSAAEGATTLMDLLAKSGAIDSEEGKKKARITDRKKMERMVHSIAFRATNSVTSRNSRSIPLPKEEERSQKKGASSVGKSAIGRSPRSKGGKGGSGSGSGKGSKGGSDGGGQAGGGKGSGSGSGSGKGSKGGSHGGGQAVGGKGPSGGKGMKWF